MTEADFGKGGVQDRYDSRDYQYKELGFGSAPYDWGTEYNINSIVKDLLATPTWNLTIKNQNGSGSCGGQAWSYYAEIKEAISTKTFEERSAKYIYAQTALPGGGSYGRDNCIIFTGQGVAVETLLPSYEGGKPPSEAFMQRSQDITNPIRDNARLAQSSSYALVGTTIDDVAQAIRDNQGVIIGVRGQNNGSWMSEFPVLPTAFEWGHWVYACRVKMINGKKHIGFVNSWGTAAGASGWQWLSEDWFKCNIDGVAAIFNVWTHVFPPAANPGPFHHTFNTNLEVGMRGEEVKALQQALTLEKVYTAGVTGYFGNATLAGTKKFQIKYNITPVFGFVGPKTRGVLNQIYAL